jgi:hypothetical protein
MRKTRLVDLAGALGGHTAPLLVGRARTAAADTADLDEVLAGVGVVAEPAAHLPLDHPGLTALEDGAGPTGRGRLSLLVRAARTVAARLSAVPVEGVR